MSESIETLRRLLFVENSQAVVEYILIVVLLAVVS